MQISTEAIKLVQEAHAGKLSDDKLAKALLAAMTGRVILAGDRVLAKSSSNPNQDYEFTLDTACPCAYGRFGNACYHEIACELMIVQRELDRVFYRERVRFTPRVQERSPRKHVDYTPAPVAQSVSPSYMGAPETKPLKEEALAELFND